MRKLLFKLFSFQSLILFFVLCFMSLAIYRMIFDVTSFSEMISTISSPIVILILIYLFRVQLKSFLADLSHFVVKRNGNEISAYREKKVNEEASEEITNEISPEIEVLDKEVVEKLMKVAAAWGYQMSKIGFQNVPEPVINWKDNQPEILYGRSNNPNNADEKQILIADIQKIRMEIDSLGPIEKWSSGLNPSREKVLHERLKRSKEMLRKIDPTSVFLD